MIDNITFQPNWSSPPGDTVADLLEERKLSLREFSKQIGLTVDYISDLLHGNAPITIDIALRLEQALGVSAAFWMKREFQYREDVNYLLQEEPSTTTEEWLKELPIKDMIKFGWLNPVQNTAEKITACLRYFGVPNVAAWHDTYSNVLETTAFRSSSSFDSKSGAVAAWLRQGEIESTWIECKNWSAANFRNALEDIRALTRKRDPNIFIPAVKKLCAECGVAVVIARAPTGCSASGATLFLSPNKALLLLSFRYLSDDQFWFSFFHEAGHLLLHGKDGLFLEGMESCTNKEEKEANSFSASTLIPEQFQTELAKLPLDGREVIRFARKVGVAPGIVVGQLQHLGLITRRQLNNLKTRFSWTD
jgi:HTH-type transcriptional regulator/antitoxin HigA